MSHSFERRHSRWYEQVVLGLPFQLVGLSLVILIPGLERWGWEFWVRTQEAHSNTLIAIAFAFVTSVLIQRRVARYPGSHVAAYIVPTVTTMFVIAVAFLFFTREGYSRQVLFSGYILTLAWCFSAYFLGRRYRKLKLALIPLGEAGCLVSVDGVDMRPLVEPSLDGVRYDGVVADLSSIELTPEWDRFLARCTLNKIPVYHFRQISESLTGRVQINHLSENEFGTLLPNPFYTAFKRMVDVAAVLLTFPITLPLMLATAIAVKLDSPGPVLFKQQRVGQGDRDYTIYKFRSMCQDSEKDGAQLAQSGDMRVTRVGRVIRKTRLDELPQFFNVLKGDMSLIGPRPEQRAFVEQFEKEIPFYIYRHVVKPGISGWAQVVQGYASDADDTRIKVQHDFYYIKHFSLWLDVLIVFKTLKTIFTGFGAK